MRYRAFGLLTSYCDRVVVDQGFVALDSFLVGPGVELLDLRLFSPCRRELQDYLDRDA